MIISRHSPRRCALLALVTGLAAPVLLHAGAWSGYIQAEARVFQHELDHLDNVLLVDRMTQADRIRTKDDIEELRRSYEAIS